MGVAPVFVLQLYARNERANLTAPQRNVLRAILISIAHEGRIRREWDGQAR